MYKYIIKTFVVILIGLIVLIGYKKNPNFKEEFKKEVYSENIGFAKINNFYEKYFGDSMFFKDLMKTEPVFNEMEIKNYTYYKDGIEVEDISLVTSLKEGIVTFVGKKDNYNNVIIVNDEKNYEIWYGNIQNTDVELYDYLEKGNIIGEVNNKLYIVIKKDGNIISYDEYIK